RYNRRLGWGCSLLPLIAESARTRRGLAYGRPHEYCVGLAAFSDFRETSIMLRRLYPLKPYLRRYKKRYVLGFGALLIGQAVGVTVPLIIKAGIDSLTHAVTSRKLLFYAGFLLVVALVKAVFQFWMRWILIGISRDVEYDLRNDLFAHLMRLSQRYYNRTRTGDLMSKLTNDLNAVRNLVGPGLMYSASTVVVRIVVVNRMHH